MAKSRSKKRASRQPVPRTSNREPMICKPCGIPMNHHAEKLVDPTNATEARRMDSALGGLVMETHCCPGCGQTASRPGV